MLENLEMYSEKIIKVLEKRIGKSILKKFIKVLGVLDSHPGTVCAVLSGHDHEGEIVFFWGEVRSNPNCFHFWGESTPIPIRL